MNRKLFIFGLYIGLFFNYAIAEELTVPDDVSSISDAVSMSVDGDVVFVRPGVYCESIPFQGKEVTLKSLAGPEVTIIDQTGASCGIEFSGGETNNSIIDGFTILEVLDVIGNTSPTIRNSVLVGMGCGANGGHGSIASGAAPVFNSVKIINGCAGIGGGYDVVDSSATFTNCTMSGNEASSQGGALYIRNSNVVIDGCTFSNNQANLGGAILLEDSIVSINDSAFIENSGNAIATSNSSSEITLNISNSTIASNTGNGLYLESGSGRVNILNGTIARNRGGFDGAGISSSPTMIVEVKNSIIANNIATERPDCDDLGPITSLGNNLFGDPEGCGTLQSSDDTGDPGLADFVVDPGIAGQARIPLLANSKAIDSADSLACPPIDQLGVYRSIDGSHGGVTNCDKGAIEFSSTFNSSISLSKFRTEYQHDDDRAKAGVFSIFATFVNNSSLSIVQPFFEVKELKSLGANADSVILLNADGGPGRLGARVNSQNRGPRIMLPPGGAIFVLFEIGLESPDRFKLLVDMLGETNY